MGLAYAMGNGVGVPKGAGGDFQFFIMMGIIFLIFYFLLIRPQQKKQKELKDMIANIKHGDTVVTTGGLHGKVVGITESIVTLEIADKVNVKVSRGHIVAVAGKPEI
jgi:preprotein translocase subunit YajC